MAISEGEVQNRLQEFLSTITIIDYSDLNEIELVDLYSKLNPQAIELIDNLSEINIDSVSKLLVDEPETILVFEKLLREERFSNAQLAYFCFDLDKINYGKVESSAEIFDIHYNINPSFKEKLEKMKNFKILNIENIECLNNEEKSIFLRTISYKSSGNSDYLLSLLKNPELNIETANRVASYLINKLKLREVKSGLLVENYLKNKIKFHDTKGMHGKWGKRQLINILEKYNIQEGKELGEKVSYLTETNVPGIFQPETNNKPKRLNLVIYYFGIPKFAIEVNYYTTSGTKININIEEYLDILRSVKNNLKDIKFIWITDGTGWLENSNIEKLKYTLFPEFGNNLMNIFQFSRWVKNGI